MKSLLTTLTPPTSTSQTKTILSKDGFTCLLVTIAAGDETPLRESEHVEEHLLYVVEGQATVCFDDVNTVIDRDHALLIPKSSFRPLDCGTHCGTRVVQLRQKDDTVRDRCGRAGPR